VASRSSRPRLLAPLLGVLGVLLVAAAAWWLLDEGGAPVEAPTPPKPVERAPEAQREVELPVVEPDVSAPPEEPEPRPMAALSGRLVDDRFLPVGAGEVQAFRGQRSLFLAGGGNLKPVDHAAVPVGPDGRFHLEPLPATSELVLVLRGASFVTQEAGPFTTLEGEALDVGDLVVESGYTVRGLVRNLDGRPLPDATVSLQLASGYVSDPGNAADARVRTDADGRFVMEHVPRFVFTLCASAAGYGNGCVEGGSPLGDDLREQELVIELRPAEVLRGRVLAEDGEQPVRGAVIVAAGDSESPGGARTVSEADGSFQLTDIARGGYDLTIEARGWNRAQVHVAVREFDDPVEVRLRPTGSLRGRVLDPQGKPVTRFDLRARFATDKASSGSPTDILKRVRHAEGEFELDDLATGWYRLEAWADGYALTTTESLHMSPGRALQGVTITLVPGARLTGLVLTASREPVVGAAVSLHQNRLANIQFLRSREWREPWQTTVRTDAEGRFTFEDIVPGLHQIQIDHKHYPVLLVDDVKATSASTTELQPILLPPAASLSGTASDANGQALPRATVSLGGPVGLSTRTDGEGHFRFDRLPPGEYYIECVADGSAHLAFGEQVSAALALEAITLGEGEQRVVTVVGR